MQVVNFLHPVADASARVFACTVNRVWRPSAVAQNYYVLLTKKDESHTNLLNQNPVCYEL